MNMLLYFASFAAMAVLLVSAIAAAIWAVCDILRSMVRLPRALRDLRTRDRHTIQADLNRHKRAGA